MTKAEFKNLIKDVQINNFIISGAEELYGKLPEEVKRILSYKDNDMFIGEWRVVSRQELLNSTEELYVDFRGENLVPVLDIMDNDYICYDLKSEGWTLFNIVDNIKFNAKRDVGDYLDE